MPAVSTHELRVASPARHEADAMPAAHADGWMRDVQLFIALRLQERMAAVARELPESVAIHDRMHPMPEETTEVANLLVEDRRFGVGIVVSVEEERVAAIHAGVLAMAISLDYFGVRMVAEEARQRVPNVSEGSVLGQVPGATRTLSAAGGWGLEPESVVVHLVSPHRTPPRAQPLLCGPESRAWINNCRRGCACAHNGL